MIYSFDQFLLNCTDYALAGLTESGSTETKSTYTSEAKDTSIKKIVNGVDCYRVNGVDGGINGVDKIINGVQNGVHGVTNGNVKFVEQNSIKSNSQERGSPTKHWTVIFKTKKYERM